MIEKPLALPCGAEIPNRLCKAAMTEGLASPSGEPTPALNQLYGIWSDGGAGLLLSGNVQIDGDHLERPGNVIIDSEPSAAMQVALETWAAAGHPRRQPFLGANQPRGPAVSKDCKSASQGAFCRQAWAARRAVRGA